MNRILVIRRDNIGDLVCTTPLFDALRGRWPDAWIAALVNTYNAEVLDRNPSLDAVYAYEKKKHRRGSLLANLIGRVRTVAQLRARKLDYVLVPAATPRSLRLAASLKPRKIVAAKSGATIRGMRWSAFFLWAARWASPVRRVPCVYFRIRRRDARWKRALATALSSRCISAPARRSAAGRSNAMRR